MVHSPFLLVLCNISLINQMIGRYLKKFWWIFITLLSACGSGNKFDVDISKIDVKINHTNWIPVLKEKKPERFLQTIRTTSRELGKYYLGSMIQTNPEQDSLCIQTLDLFMNFPSTVESIKEIENLYGSPQALLAEIGTGFKYVKYHFPETKNQHIITYHSGFNFGVFPVENEIGIGLEMYLGPTNKVTLALGNEQFPQYIKNNMTKENLIVDVFRGYTLVNLIPDPQEDDLLATLVNEGKVLYAMDAFLPHKKDHEKIRYSPKQLEWCTTYEKEIWKTIIDNKWLYSTDKKMIGQFINEAPFTATLPQESPPRAGAWLGWQMVRAYAEEHSELSLKEILLEKDARKILRSYRPK